MADSPQRVTWRGKDLSTLTDQELEEAFQFLDKGYLELQAWAPVHIWAFMSSCRADIIIEMAKRKK